MRGRLAISISPAISTVASPSARWSCGRGGRWCRLVRGSWPIRIPASEFEESCDKARALLKAIELAQTELL